LATAGRRLDEAPITEPAWRFPGAEKFWNSLSGLLPIALYQPDCAALHGGPARGVVAGGTTSKGEFTPRTAAAFAEHFGTPLIDFPGGHGGFAGDAREFATLLCQTLISSRVGGVRR
jgi:hypothetical protein